MTSDERPLGGPAITPEDGSLYDDCDELQPDVASSKASLASSVYNYRYENGRRYHAYREGEYVIPNDEREQDRLDLLHHIFLLVLNGELYSAPIPKGISRVLDLGTGTGTWAIDMADQNPQAIVTGTDLSPIQSTWVAPNCNFEIDDFELDWNFSYSFDFIHARNIEGSVRDYHKLFGQALKYLNDDGWFELAEPTVGVFCDDDTIGRAPSFLEWRDKLIEASIIFKKPMAVAKNYKNWLIDAGFVNVKEEIYKVPFSAWARDPKMKEIGMYQQAMMLEALDAYSYALFTRVLGWSTAQIQVLLAGVRKELCDPKFHGYSRYYFVYGQKPSPSTS